MATIKVTYNSISRRFNITSPNWVELESKLRSLYNIPTTSSLIVSYNDEDGDVITLSSDLELKEILSQQSAGRPIKLILSTVENLIFEDENDNDVVNNKSSNIEVNNNHIEDSLQQNQQQTTELEEENVESRPPSYYQHVTLEEEEPEDDQSTPLLNKEKEKESEKRPENTNENKAQPENENKENKDDEDDDDDEIIFVISCPWARQSFFGPRFGHGFGPRFGFFGGPRFGLFDGLFGGPRYNSFSPFNYYGRPQCHRSAFFNGYGPSAYYFSSRQCGPDACNENSKPSCCSKQQQSNHCNKNSEASTSASAKTNKCNKDKYNHSTRFPCGKNYNFFHPQNNKTTFTQEQLSEKLSTLHSMGFDSSNNALYEDLLKRYNGNLERVIELLLRNQQVNEYYDNDNDKSNESKKQNGIVINEEKTNNDEIKQVDNEESKPYNL